MSTTNESPFPLATELLIASFTPDLTPSSRNEAWQSLFGNTDEIWSNLSKEDQGLATQFLKDASTGTLVTNRIFFVHLMHRDLPIPVMLHFIPVTFTGASPSLQQVCVTVTGETLIEPGSWILNQTQRIRVENIGRMTLGLIHEINNMLTNILGNFELIETLRLLPDGHERLNQILEVIHKAALDGASMTQSIKSYIRNEKTSSFELLDLTQLIGDCISFTKPYWYNEPRRKGIEIKLINSLTALPHIMGSTVELKEVFINLITNAVQAMPRGGKLTLSNGRDQDDNIIIKVTDTGNGISEKIKQRIFEPMFTTKGKMGTGMGLSLCQSILQNHDAQIDVDSALGQGTTFILTFQPAAHHKQAEQSIVEPIEQPPVNILAVDDEPGVRNILSNLLKTKGHSVYVASSGHEALDQLNATEIDIVFTDHGMPEMNGQQLAKAIRQTNPDMPIVLVTGDTEFDQHLEDIDAIVGKPFFLDDLQKVIHDLLVTQ